MVQANSGEWTEPLKLIGALDAEVALPNARNPENDNQISFDINRVPRELQHANQRQT